MNRILDKMFLTMVLAVAALGLVGLASGDTGPWGAVRREQGTYNGIRRVALSSTTGTAFYSDATKRPDGYCQSNGNYIIWVGTDSASYFAVEHPNITNGTFILSSGTYRLDGSFTGTKYATCGAGTAACELRCEDGLVR